MMSDQHLRRSLGKGGAAAVDAAAHAAVGAFEQRVIEAAIFNGAAIDEQVLVFAGRARDAGLADKTPQANRFIAGGNFQRN